MADRWEVERDRFGVMFSGPLEVGDCIQVVPLARAEKAEALRDELRAKLESLKAECDELGAMYTDAIERTDEAEAESLTAAMRRRTTDEMTESLREIGYEQAPSALAMHRHLMDAWDAWVRRGASG